uniref:Nicotinamide phosphoribosyltransferase n=1 Tax=Parastrongyloides trichosuri TaxID=131310 RepID=A0A0N4ZCK9_PARTI
MDCGPVENILFLADSYKATHHTQYPDKTTFIYSYFESRGGKFNKTVFFGLQYLIKRYLCGRVVDKQMIEEATDFYHCHFGGMNYFNREGWEYIVEKHQGCLPLRIKAVPEGTVVPVKNVLLTVENTDPKVAWLTSWFETLLVQVWYPMTVATNSREQKKIIAEYLLSTSDSLDGLPFKLHDFGYRGASSVETAAIGSASHLVNFTGTDTVAGLQFLRKYYSSPMAGYSIPAAEHSTIISWRKSGEADAYRHMLERFPVGLISVVSDSYDVYDAVANIWGEELKDLVMERNGRGCVIIRPDSGDPSTVVIKILNLLAEKYPISMNSKGYRVLPSYLRIMQGDGISYETIGSILEALKQDGWSTENLAFGTGGALLQKLDRDTQKCAFKCSSVTVNGKCVDVFKNPSTDSTKKSKKGRLTLEKKEDGSFVTMQEGLGDDKKDLLLTVFENGKLLIDYTLDEIRQRAELTCVKEFYKNRQNNISNLNGTIISNEPATSQNVSLKNAMNVRA